MRKLMRLINLEIQEIKTLDLELTLSDMLSAELLLQFGCKVVYHR